MARLFIFLTAIELVVLVLALISSLSADRVRNLPRAVWVLVIVLIPLLGPVTYFLFGRPVAPPTETRPDRRIRARPPAPDDDPDFLRSVDTEQSRRERDLLAQWERDLQNREDD